MKYIPDWINDRLDIAEKRLMTLKGISIRDYSQYRERRKWKMQRAVVTCGTTPSHLIYGNT